MKSLNILFYITPEVIYRFIFIFVWIDVKSGNKELGEKVTKKTEWNLSNILQLIYWINYVVCLCGIKHSLLFAYQSMEIVQDIRYTSSPSFFPLFYIAVSLGEWGSSRYLIQSWWEPFITVISLSHQLHVKD